MLSLIMQFKSFAVSMCALSILPIKSYHLFNFTKFVSIEKISEPQYIVPGTDIWFLEIALKSEKERDRRRYQGNGQSAASFRGKCDSQGRDYRRSFWWYQNLYLRCFYGDQKQYEVL